MKEVHYGAGNLYDELIATLKTENNFVADNGDIKKWVVAEQARAYSQELIEMLLDNEQLKNAFFVAVKGRMVFLLDKFLQFIEQKNYINDSYTRFSQKVGLQVGGKFLSQRNEVELVFPYKDCVLEGGQTKDDQKRNEIFFNEVLAQDEITQLLDPKVLTEAKRIDAHGEHPLDAFRRDEATNVERNLPKQTITDNFIIRGNNLLALHTLKHQFRGKVKLIYIDPPFNTEDDSFSYNDSFTHSTWLTFIKNRLDIARELLSDDGFICVHIGNDEFPYLQVLMDDIFGRHNFLNIISVSTNDPSGFKSTSSKIFSTSNHLILYAKNAVKAFLNKVYKPKTYDENYKYIITNPDEPFSNWKYSTIKKVICSEMHISERIFNSYSENERIRIMSSFADKHRKWVFRTAAIGGGALAKRKSTIEQSKRTKGVVFQHPNEDVEGFYILNGENIVFWEKLYREIDGVFQAATVLTDIWTDIKWTGIASEGGVKLKNGKKPELLLKRIIELTTQKNDLVLDFFAGSGTTPAVCMKMKRQFISCEQIDYQVKMCIERMSNVVRGDTSGISSAVHWRGGGDFVYLELKRSNKQFIDDIEAAVNTDQLLAIWEQMKKRAFFRFSLDMQQFEENIEQFKSLSLDEQRAALCSVLDLNQLYVNRVDMNDEELQVSEEEKRVTNDFYSK